MEEGNQAPFTSVAISDNLTVGDLFVCLAAGVRDFVRFPLFGLFFSAVYVATGLFLAYALVEWGESGWIIAAASGFPIIAPFTAVGIYEVSRRRELDRAMSWGGVLGALRGNDDEQLLLFGGMLFVAFGFWMILAHGIFAIFMAGSGIGHNSLGLLATGPGIAMLVVGGIVGAVIALAFYAITVVSLPMLLDRKVDMITAVITSLRVINANKPVLLIWAVIIAVLVFLAMLPAFLGLFIALPVLGHASWHLYRRAVLAPNA